MRLAIPRLRWKPRPRFGMRMMMVLVALCALFGKISGDAFSKFTEERALAELNGIQSLRRLDSQIIAQFLLES